MTPLEYMLSIINDPGADPARRDRMAAAAAPFCHPRVAENRFGKKDQQAEAAKAASTGRFAPRPPPKLVVDNK